MIPFCKVAARKNNGKSGILAPKLTINPAAKVAFSRADKGELWYPQ